MNNLTFDQLADLIHDQGITNETDKKIAKKIFEAETDWRTSIETLNDFIIILEKEINGEVTESSLKKLQEKYTRNIGQYAWESESVCSLLDIFQLTGEKELKEIFINLIEKVKTK